MINFNRSGYHSDESSFSFRGRIIKAENLTPDNSSIDSQKKKICGELFEIFEQYSAEKSKS